MHDIEDFFMAIFFLCSVMIEFTVGYQIIVIIVIAK